MSSAMASRAEKDRVVDVEPEVGMTRPRLQVVNMERAPTFLRSAAVAAAVAVAISDEAHHGVPLGRCVRSLSLG
jgi:hypothetical protein